MKNNILTILLLVFSITTSATESLFSKYSDIKGVDIIELTGDMLQSEPQIKVEGVDVSQVCSKLSFLQIISASNKEIIKKIKQDVDSTVQANSYGLLSMHNSAFSKLSVYIKNQEKTQKDLIIVSQGVVGFSVINMTGNLSMDEIQNMIKDTEKNIGYKFPNNTELLSRLRMLPQFTDYIKS